MLDRLRQSAGSWVAKFFIGVLVLSFAVWGVADIFSGNQGTTLATVGDQQVSAAEFQTAFRREMTEFSRRTGRQISVEQARQAGLDRQILRRLISQAALDQQVRSLNLAIPDKLISSRIVTNPLFQNSSGKFDRGRFEQLLMSNGFSEQAYVFAERRNMLRTHIADTVSDGIQLPEVLTSAIYRQQNETRTANYFILPVAKVGNVGEPEPADLKAFYEDNQASFRAPEYRKLVVLRLEPEDLSKQITVPEDQLREAYKERISDYQVAERRQAQQIVFPTMEEAVAAREKLLSGGDFLAIAKERGFSDEDIDLGTVSRKDLPDPAIAQAVFGLNAGEVSEPIAGSLSIVLIRVSKIIPGSTKPFSAVKAELAKKLSHEKAQEDLLNIHDAVEDERAGGATLAEIAKRLRLPLFEIAAVDRAGLDPSGKTVAALDGRANALQLAFSSEVGLENDPVDTDDSGFMWVDVVGITPSEVRPFEQVKEKVTALWKRQRRRALLSDRAKELKMRVEGGQSLSGVAEQLGVRIETSKPLKRRDRDPVFTASALEKLFSVPADGLAVEIAPDGAQAMIMQVSNVTVPAYDPASKDATEMVDYLKQGLRDDLMEEYLLGLQETTGVSVNETVWRILTGQTS